uniref:Uncharacterized protein n=1 Tax=Ditylenchus dipsaci TaxID=166011 RepID=A0A915CW73_9BILA
MKHQIIFLTNYCIAAMSSSQSTSNIQSGKEKCNYPGSESSNRTKKLIDIILGVEMKIKQGIKNQLAAHDLEILDKFPERKRVLIGYGADGARQFDHRGYFGEQEALREKIDDWENHVPINPLADKNQSASGAREFFFGGTQKMRNTRIRDTRLPQEPKSRFGHKFVRPVVSQSEAIVKTDRNCIFPEQWTGRCEGTFTSSNASSRSELDLNQGRNMNQESKEHDMLSKEESVEEVSTSLKDWWNEDENEDFIQINQFTPKTVYHEKQVHQEADVVALPLPNPYFTVDIKSMSSVSEKVASVSSEPSPSIEFCAGGQEDEKVSANPMLRYSRIIEMSAEEPMREPPKLPNVKPVVGGFGNFRRGNPTPVQSSTIKPNLSGHYNNAGVNKSATNNSFSALECEDSFMKPGSFFGKTGVKVISTVGLSLPAAEKRSNYSTEGAYPSPIFRASLTQMILAAEVVLLLESRAREQAAT